MSSGLIQNPLDNSTKSFQKNAKKIKSKKSKSENKENIQRNISPQKLYEEEDINNSKKSKKNYLGRGLYNKIKKNITKREHEKYEEKMKENTMRDELEKISNENERLKQEYEEKNSKYYLFKNPQFKKFIKNVEMQLFYLLGLAALLTIFSIFMIFNSKKEFEGVPLVGLIITILLFSVNILLIACVKMGLLNDAELSKAFRIFVIIELLLLITSICFNFISIFLDNKKISNKFWIFALLILIILDLIFVVKKCLNLFIESFMILLGKKTEYSVLISKEERYDNSVSFSLNKTNSDLLEENKNKKKNEEDEMDESFKNFNYFNKFHYSVSADRKNDYILKNKKK